MFRERRVGGQWQIAVDLAEKTPGALLRQQQRMLAAPAEAGLLRKMHFHDRRRIREDAVAERTGQRADRRGQSLQTVAHDLVVVAALRVA